MLYCNNCGTEVEAGAKFCVKCFSRLDESSVRNVVDIYEISSRNKMLKEFSPDGYIYDHDLSGETVKGMRLIERIGSVAGESYYRSSDVSDGKNNVKTIHHVVLPLKESYDTLLFLNGFDNYEVTDFKSGAMFGPMMGSVPFVGYIFELEEGADVENFMTGLSENCNPAWNVCVDADQTVVGAYNNMVFFLMCPNSAN